MSKFLMKRKIYPKKEKGNKMTISKDGKNYTIPTSCKTTEGDLITISIGYRAKEEFSKDEIASLIILLTDILKEQNRCHISQ